MRILYHGNCITTPKEFLEEVKTIDYIDGLKVDVAKTKDNKIVILNPTSNQNLAVEKISNSTLQETKESNFILLDDLMKQYQSIKKRMIVMALVGAKLLSFQEIDTYTTALAEVVNQYPDTEIGICSLSHSLILNIIPKIKKAKIGVVLEPANLNYIDVDFYVFNANMLDARIFKQQDNNGKESMIDLTSWTNLQQTINFFREENTKKTLTEAQINRISLIGNYPEIIYRSIQKI